MTLFNAAMAARDNAYAPYSRFRVGAAIRSTSGRIYTGCNVENVAYPEGTCAEAGAIAAMVSAGDTAISEILVVAGGPVLISPCGGCRQKIAEFAGAGIPVTMANPDGMTHTLTLGDLLPAGFGEDHLKGGKS